MRKISSWGRLNKYNHDIIYLNNPKKHIDFNKSLGIAIGNGRSYGDVGLNPNGVVWNTTSLNNFIKFDCKTGLIACESGVLLRDIQEFVIPLGWMLPVTPGTQLVTVGGAVANDIHGKNHHQFGTFGDHVIAFGLMRTNGEYFRCSRDLKSNWFSASVGGMGLTGIIMDVEIQLKKVPSAWLKTETIPYSQLNDFFQLSDNSEQTWEYTVSWIDCLSKVGRGLFMRANSIDGGSDTEKRGRELRIPFEPPISLINRFSLLAFNTAYYKFNSCMNNIKTVHYQKFFYPLDNILEWNKIYGPKGFFQYQSVVPKDIGVDVTRAMLSEIARSGEGSFLAVLKNFGNHKSVGMMSFPMPGVTIALDFPNNGDRTEKLFKRLDAIVSEANGRIYLAKDARMPRNLFEKSYSNLNEFIKYRDPGISSALSRRLMGS